MLRGLFEHRTGKFEYTIPSNSPWPTVYPEPSPVIATYNPSTRAPSPLLLGVGLESHKDANRSEETGEQMNICATRSSNPKSDQNNDKNHLQKPGLPTCNLETLVAKPQICTTTPMQQKEKHRSSLELGTLADEANQFKNQVNSAGTHSQPSGSAKPSTNNGSFNHSTGNDHPKGRTGPEVAGDRDLRINSGENYTTNRTQKLEINDGVSRKGMLANHLTDQQVLHPMTDSTSGASAGNHVQVQQGLPSLNSSACAPAGDVISPIDPSIPRSMHNKDISLQNYNNQLPERFPDFLPGLLQSPQSVTEQSQKDVELCQTLSKATLQETVQDPDFDMERHSSILTAMNEQNEKDIAFQRTVGVFKRLSDPRPWVQPGTSPSIPPSTSQQTAMGPATEMNNGTNPRRNGRRPFFSSSSFGFGSGDSENR